jgi:hypothetical protein
MCADAVAHGRTAMMSSVLLQVCGDDPNVPEMPEMSRNAPKCGVQHSDPAVVGRKSGPRKIADDELCIVKLTGAVLSRSYCLAAQDQRRWMRGVLPDVPKPCSPLAQSRFFCGFAAIR